MIDDKCSSCGRADCVNYGDEACQAARKKFFDDMRARIEFFEKMKAEKNRQGKCPDCKGSGKCACGDCPNGVCLPCGGTGEGWTVEIPSSHDIQER